VLKFIKNNYELMFYFFIYKIFLIPITLFRVSRQKYLKMNKILFTLYSKFYCLGINSNNTIPANFATLPLALLRGKSDLNISFKANKE
jgi:uncharacterized membrane protein YbhN (UPF0104 family)